MLPIKSYTPNIPKSKKKKKKKISTLPKAGKDYSRDLIILLILGITLILLKGLMTLKVRMNFSLGTSGNISIHL